MRFEIRGLLAGYAIAVTRGIAPLRLTLPLILEDRENQLGGRSGRCWWRRASGRTDSGTGVRPVIGAGLWPGRMLPTSGPARRGRGRRSRQRWARATRNSSRAVGNCVSTRAGPGQSCSESANATLICERYSSMGTLGGAHCGRPKRSS
jgi:hypothetical protein